MSKLEKLKERARSLEAKDPRGAIEAWLELLKAQDEEGDPNPDLSVFNRVGDLYLKIKDPAQAADYYDRAVDKYAELGFYNNAIAMCNKVLRNAPGRPTTYLKLAKLYAAKGFLAQAKQHFIEYAERMQKAGRIEQAFAALKEFTDLAPENAAFRELLAEHLRHYGEPGRRATQPVARPAEPEPRETLTKSGKHKTSSLVFLDLDEPAGKASAPRAARAAGPGRPPAPPPAAPVAEPAVTPLEIETTSLGEGLGPAASEPGPLEGFETTSAAFGEVRLEAGDVPSLREEPTPGEVAPLAELEPTVPADAGVPPETLEPEPLLDIEIAPPAPPAPPPPPPSAAPPGVTPVVPTRPEAPRPPGHRPGLVDLPPLQLEPDFETAGTAAGHELDDQPLAFDDTVPARRSAFLDLDAGEAGPPGARHAGSLVFDNLAPTPVAPTLEDLVARVADDPDDPEAHRALGEALIEAGERERGIEELELATQGFERRGDLREAQDLVEEILRLEPNSVRHRQKQVEFAFKAGDKPKLIAAYVELADTLLRNDLPEKARAVYERVLEHEPGNARAQAALSLLAPAAPPAPSPAPPPAGPGRARAADEGPRAVPKDAKVTVRADTAEHGEFVDLGALILEDERPAGDPRMKVAEEEPTGDEERDFHEMLARFRQGIAEHLDEADFQSHYDLGVAFKEMGLLDEAISEFQKALRAPEGKLKTSEALGVCFIEKGVLGVAESVLRRALELPASGDEERLGILYWLGRVLEQQGRRAEARELYGRVYAVDIRFKDVGERARALANAR
jgi:tetratricopeptide (TPR) repeat protein